MRWQYRTFTMKTSGFLGGKVDTEAFDKALNDQGRDGWELVAVFDTNVMHGRSSEIVAVLKRQS